MSHNVSVRSVLMLSIGWLNSRIGGNRVRHCDVSTIKKASMFVDDAVTASQFVSL